MEEDIIDPALGVTPELSNKPQAPSASEFYKNNPVKSRITPHTQVMGADLDIGTDLFGKSNLERVNEEFGGVNVFTQDFARLRAAEQPWFHQAIGAVNQAVIGEIVGGTIAGVGYLAEIPGVISGAAFQDKEFGNWLSQIGTGMQEWTREATPIHQLDPGTFSPGDSGWWFGNAPSVASMFGLMIPAMGVTKGLSMLGKGAQALGAYGKAGKAVAGVAKFMGGGANKAAQTFMTAATQAGFSRHMENMMEASGTFEETYNKHLAKGKSEEEATKAASEAAAHNYKWGWGLYMQDLLQYGLMAKFPGVKGKYRDTNVIEDSVYGALGSVGKVGQFLNKHRSIGNGVTTFLSEGAEEATQFIISKEAGYLADVKAGLIDESDFMDRMGDYSKDGELWTSAFFGGFGGVAAHVGGQLVGKKERASYAAAKDSWLKMRGVQFAKLAEDMVKADASQDVNAQVRARAHSVMAMTTEALDLGTYDSHINDMEKMVNMTPEQLAEYNQANPGAEVTEEFQKNVLPSLIEDTKKIKELYVNNMQHYEVDTVGAITQREFLSDYFKAESKKSKDAVPAAIAKINNVFNPTNSTALQKSLELQGLRSQLESIEHIDKTLSTDETKNLIGDINNKIKEVSEELSTMNVTPTEQKDIDGVLNDVGVKVPNMKGASADALSMLFTAEATKLKSTDYQANTKLRSREKAINAAVDNESLDAVSAEINGANLTKADKSLLQKQVDNRRRLIKESEETEKKEEVENEALDEGGEEVADDSVGTGEDFSDGGTEFDFGLTPPPASNTPTEPEEVPSKKEPLPTAPVDTFAGVLEVNTKYLQYYPGWVKWLDSGVEVDGTKVRINRALESNYPGKGKETIREAIQLFNKYLALKPGEKLTPEEKTFIIDNYPIKYTVLDVDGNPLDLGGHSVYNHIYAIKVTEDSAQFVEANRHLRGYFIAALLKNETMETTLSSNIKKNSDSDNLINTSPTEEGHLDILNKYRLTGTPDDFVAANRGDNYIDETKSLDEDLSGLKDIKKKDDKPSAGNIFVKIKTPNTGVIIPVRLNKAKVTKDVAELLADMHIDAVVHGDDNSDFFMSVPISSLPAREAQLKKLLPNYEELIGKYPTYQEVKDFFVYNKAVDVKNPKAHDIRYSPKKSRVSFKIKAAELKKVETDPATGSELAFTNKQDAPYVLNEVTTHEDGSTTYFHIKEGKLYMNKTKAGEQGVGTDTLIWTSNIVTKANHKMPIVRNSFIEFFTSTVRRQVDINKLRNNEAYRTYILDNKILNTDIDQQVFDSKKAGEKEVIKINVKEVKKLETPVGPKVSKVDAVTEEGLASTDNKTAEDKGGVSINVESAAVRKSKENKGKKPEPKCLND